jgi:hypothetical protein
VRWLVGPLSQLQCLTPVAAAHTISRPDDSPPTPLPPLPPLTCLQLYPSRAVRAYSYECSSAGKHRMWTLSASLQREISSTPVSGPEDVRRSLLTHRPRAMLDLVEAPGVCHPRCYLQLDLFVEDEDLPRWCRMKWGILGNSPEVRGCASTRPQEDRVSLATPP